MSDSAAQSTTKDESRRGHGVLAWLAGDNHAFDHLHRPSPEGPEGLPPGFWPDYQGSDLAFPALAAERSEAAASGASTARQSGERGRP